MKITFEFEDNPKELELKKMIKSFYKSYLGFIEGRFDEDDEEESKILEEIKNYFQMEADSHSIILNLNSSLLEDIDIDEFKSSIFSNGLFNLI